MSSSQGVQADPKALMELHDLTETDLALIRKFGKIMTPKMDEYVRHFYTWLETLPEYKQFFNDSSRLNRVQTQQLRYWESFFEADINNKYIAERIALGKFMRGLGFLFPPILLV